MRLDLDTERSADRQEHRLWSASQRYMNGEITMEELDEIERPYGVNLKTAVIGFAKIKPKLDTKKSADNQEHHLWAASRHYMGGEINMEELNEIEHPYAVRLKKALVVVAKQNIKRRFVDLFSKVGLPFGKR